MPWVVFVPVMKRKSKQLKSLSWRIRALLPLIVLVIIFLVAFQGCLFWFETAKQTDVKKQNSEELHRGYALVGTERFQPPLFLPSFRFPGYSISQALGNIGWRIMYTHFHLIYRELKRSEVIASRARPGSKHKKVLMMSTFPKLELNRAN